MSSATPTIRVVIQINRRVSEASTCWPPRFIHFALFLLLFCVCPAQAYAEPPANQGLYLANNADAVFAAVVMARAKLDTYDYLKKTLDGDPARGWELAPILNELRGEIIYDAIGAFYRNGPHYLPSSAGEMRELLFIARDRPSWKQAPSSLDELVVYNYLTHLPESPYPNAAITSLPAEDLPPGTILYRPVATKVPYTTHAGALEFCILAVIGTEETGMLPEVVEALFQGNIFGLIEVIPKNIVWFEGFHPAENSTYAKKVEALKAIESSAAKGSF